MRVLFASSEVTPFAKTGGLADVAGTLPKALHQRSHDVRVIMPRYQRVDVADSSLRLVLPQLTVSFPGRRLVGRIYEGRLPESDVPVYFVDSPTLYDRPGIYGEGGADYPDNALRFAFFSLA
ncbi:glycogen/starch synthase, partial [bacterium]|nr:glycogen/starch synthase [bacterium]